MNRATVVFIALAILLAHTLAIHQNPDGDFAAPYDWAHVAYRLGRNLAHQGRAPPLRHGRRQLVHHLGMSRIGVCYPSSGPSRERWPSSTQKGLPGLFLYGIAYGLATLGCSAPIFFSTLFYALTSGGFLAGIVTFVVYAIGMGLPILLITILLAKTKTQLLNRVMNVMPWFEKISSVIIIAIGIYLISYYILIFA